MKKINVKTLLVKTVLYRIFVIVIQIAYTMMFIKNFEQAVNISVSWNIVNIFLYMGYSYFFDKKQSPYIETKGSVIWFTGKPCSGKSTIADALAIKLKNDGFNVERLDGDIVRAGKLSNDLGFTKEDRDKNINRVTFVSKLLSRNNTIVLASFVSPYKETRDMIRKSVTNFVEVDVNVSSDMCAQRDVKGMWKLAKEGKIKGFTGYDAPYEIADKPEIVCYTGVETIQESTNKVYNYMKENRLLR